MSDHIQQRRPRLAQLLFTLLVLLAPHVALAQFDAATVLGLIKDESGGAVPGATVTLTNVDTGIVATAVSEIGRASCRERV